MDVRSARDLPDFRLWLIDQWRPGGEFDGLEDLLFPFAKLGIKPDPAPAGWVDGEVQRYTLPRAALWWVTDEMTTLVEHAAESLPETTLTNELLPDDDGLVVFAHSLVGTQSDDGSPITTDAILWSRGQQRSTGQPSVEIASYHFLSAGAQIGNTLYGYHTNDADRWTPTGTATWLFGEDTEATLDDQVETSKASTSEDRRWLAALWLLASQPLAAVETQRAYRQAAKRSKRRQVPSDVRLVDMRRAATPRPETHKSEGGRRWGHRTIVGGESGGFWRQQACGPRWSQRRPVWIEPYMAGPEDGPLVVKDVVKVIRE